MTNKEKIEEMAKEIYINAIMGSHNIGSVYASINISESTRSKTFESVRNLSFQAAKIFYEVK